jgi:hypothetical protein
VSAIGASPVAEGQRPSDGGLYSCEEAAYHHGAPEDMSTHETDGPTFDITDSKRRQGRILQCGPPCSS